MHKVVYNPKLFVDGPSDQKSQQEPCEDAISRQELLEDLYKRDYTKFTHRDFVALVQYQDTVQQEPKTGHWIDTGSGQECSECGEIQHGYDNFRFYCAKCGSKNVTESESDEE